MLALIPAVLLNSGICFTEDETGTVRILFTNNSNGKLENCHCRNDHTGGMGERVGFIRTYRKKYPDFLLFDSGGYLGLSNVRRKGPAAFKLMSIMKYDALSIGDQELYGSLKQFMSMFGGYSGLMTNASLVDNDGKPVFEPYRIFTVGEIKIGVIGILSAETFRFFPDSSRDFAFEDPDVILDRLVPELRKSCDYIILLSQMGKNEDVKLAERRDDIDLIIGGHSQTLLKEALEISGCRIVQAGKGGGRLGEIVLHFGQKGEKLKNFEYKLIELGESYKIPEDIKPLIKAASSP